MQRPNLLPLFCDLKEIEDKIHGEPAQSDNHAGLDDFDLGAPEKAYTSESPRYCGVAIFRWPVFDDICDIDIRGFMSIDFKSSSKK